MGKSVTDIVLERLLKDVEENECMPWQKPYTQYNAFNYFTLKAYRGINRLILPFGEYLTATQINEYNKKHNEDFRFQKGIKWYPVVFYKFEEKEITFKDILSVFPDYSDSNKEYIGYVNGYHYVRKNSKYIKYRSILRYSNVAERKWFRNSKGELLPSRIETGEVEIAISDANNVIKDYLEREGVKETNQVPCWNRVTDVIEMNNHMKSQESWYSTMFHEMAHSTGYFTRLNREICNLSNIPSATRKQMYAEEECLAEITACLCCAECGVYNFETSGTLAYDNNVAYVQHWKKFIKENGKNFLKIVSMADMAFEYIMNFKE